MNTPKLSDLSSRLWFHSSSFLVASLLIVCAYFASLWPLFTCAMALFAALALWEYYHLAMKKGLTPTLWLGMCASTLFLGAVHMQIHFAFSFSLPFLIFGLFVFAIFCHSLCNQKNAIGNTATTLFGFIYITLPFSFLLHIAFKSGIFWLIYLIAVTKSSDMGGYFIGKGFGKKKLAKDVSPNKTYEGAIAGVCASIVMSLLFFYFGRQWMETTHLLNLTSALILGCGMGLLAEIGDLAESSLKRDAGVKDSGSVPGVGGFLDVFDSLLFTIPLLFLFLLIRGMT